MISEKTIEENILKKARQKKFLGDLAIEGGNFTTAFFKNESIKELFNVDSSGLDESTSLQNLLDPQKASSSSEPVLIEEIEDEKTNKFNSQLGQALNTVEDDDDVKACKIATAEASAEFAEFDESIPLDADKNEEKSPEEKELESIVEQVPFRFKFFIERILTNLLFNLKQLTPIEQYAMKFVELIQEPIQAEQLKQAEVLFT